MTDKSDVGRMVHAEIENAGTSPAWQGYVVAVTPEGRVFGAAGGGVREGTVGQVLVLSCG